MLVLCAITSPIPYSKESHRHIYFFFLLFQFFSPAYSLFWSHLYHTIHFAKAQLIRRPLYDQGNPRKPNNARHQWAFDTHLPYNVQIGDTALLSWEFCMLREELACKHTSGSVVSRQCWRNILRSVFGSHRASVAFLVWSARQSGNHTATDFSSHHQHPMTSGDCFYLAAIARQIRNAFAK